jgi:hypothetical protein
MSSLIRKKDADERQEHYSEMEKNSAEGEQHFWPIKKKSTKMTNYKCIETSEEILLATVDE